MKKKTTSKTATNKTAQKHDPGQEVILRKLGGQILRAENADDEEQYRFEISFSSEEPDDSWWDPEILVHTSEAVDLTRLKQAGSLLFAHGFDKIGKMPIGGLENIQLDETRRRCTATIILDDEDETAREIARKIRKGYLSGISVGCRVKEWMVLRENETTVDGRFTGPAMLAVKWEPYEISIEPTPADPSVGIGRSIKTTKGDKGMKRRKSELDVVIDDEELLDDEVEEELDDAVAEGTADEETLFEEIEDEIDTEIDLTLEDEEPEEEDTLERSAKAERKRAAQITMRCKKFGVDPTKFIVRGYSVERVNKVLLDAMSRKKSVPRASVGASGEDKFRAAASDSILLRGGIKSDKVSADAKDFRHLRLRELAVETLVRSGMPSARRMDNDALLRTVLTPDSAFVGIVTDAVNKVMAVAYNAAPPTFERWVTEGSNRDFRPKNIIQISEAGELERIPQNGEIKMDHPSDNAVTSVLATFGKKFGFTREALINDDVDMLTRLPEAYVRAAMRGVNKAVYELLTSNPVMADGERLFSAAHGNLGAAAKPSIASYQEAFGMMMRQKGLRGMETLNIRPAFVLSDPMQYAEHSQLLYSTANPEAPNSGAFSPFTGLMNLVTDGELFTGSSVIPYYFASSQADCGTIEVAYLNGQREPTLDFRVGFDFLGIEYRIIHDRAVTLLDYRGLFKNPGA